MREMRDEDGRIVREPYSTRDGYQDDPGKPDEEERPFTELDAFNAHEFYGIPQTREALEGLLHFVSTVGRSVGCRLTIECAGVDWIVGVEWTGAQKSRVYAQDRSLEEACTMCRGLLAHSLATGTATL